jgi:hypothetical protein
MAVEVDAGRPANVLVTFGFGEAAEQTEKLTRAVGEPLRAVGLATALYGVAERPMPTAENAAHRTNPEDDQIGQAIHATRRQEFRVGELAGTPATPSNVLTTPDEPISRTNATLPRHIAAQPEVPTTCGMGRTPDPVRTATSPTLGGAWPSWLGGQCPRCGRLRMTPLEYHTFPASRPAVARFLVTYLSVDRPAT